MGSTYLPTIWPSERQSNEARRKALVKTTWIVTSALLSILVLATVGKMTSNEAGPLSSLLDFGHTTGTLRWSDKRNNIANQDLVALDYISSWEPPPKFHHWVKFAKKNQCHLGPYKRIEKDLQQFRDQEHPLKRHITLQQIEAAKQLGYVIVFTVKKGRLSASMNTPFTKDFTRLLHRFVRYLPDMEFVVNNRDEPRSLPGDTEDLDARFASSQCANASESFLKFRHLHGTISNRAQASVYSPSTQLLPIFSQSKINECHADITYPTLYNLDNTLTDKQEKQLLPWEYRRNILFFRGATTGGFYSAGSTNYKKAHRQRLVEHAENNPHMDIKFSSFVQCSTPVCKRMANQYGVGDYVEQMSNFDYKYLMSIDGNTFVSRLPLFLSSGSVPFRAGIYSEWFDEWVEENKHYLQIKLDYSDLDAKLQWALDNDNEMRLIGQQGRSFAKRRLRNQDMECYMYRLLLEYAAMVY